MNKFSHLFKVSLFALCFGTYFLPATVSAQTEPCQNFSTFQTTNAIYSNIVTPPSITDIIQPHFQFEIYNPYTIERYYFSSDPFYPGYQDTYLFAFSGFRVNIDPNYIHNVFITLKLVHFNSSKIVLTPYDINGNPLFTGTYDSTVPVGSGTLYSITIPVFNTLSAIEFEGEHLELGLIEICIH